VAVSAIESWRALVDTPRAWVGTVLKPLRIRRLCSDRSSARLLAELLRDPGDPGSGEVELGISALGGRSVTIRRGTSDAEVVWETFSGGYHLPPPGLSPRTVWDLGANIGLTMAHIAAVYPDAQLTGVELDPANLELCRRNLAPWADRCVARYGAVWDRPGEIEYSAEPGLEYGFRVGKGRGVRRSAPAVTLDQLADLAGHAPIDYVKMDIEGAERQVLRNATDWARLVRCINVETHEPYTVRDCVADLERLGFATRIQRRHWASVIGVRSS
jgi:FkbM family methyltransferase